MERITNAHLQGRVDYLNRITGNEKETYTKDESGFHANIGNYYISGAYGGVKLEQICSDGGGCSDISRQGFGTKRELYNWMNAYIDGIANAKTAHHAITGQ